MRAIVHCDVDFAPRLAGDTFLTRWLDRFFSLSYWLRRRFDSYVPLLLIFGSIFLLVGLLPAVDELLGEKIRAAGLWSILGGIASGFWTFWQSRKQGQG